MNQNAQELEQVENAIEQSKISIARMETLHRLEKNPDFKSLIADGFMGSHAIRQVMLKAHPGLQGEAQQKMLDAQICAIGNFKQFLIGVNQEGANALVALASDEDTREELLKEGLE
jgi:hypothetical protein